MSKKVQISLFDNLMTASMEFEVCLLMTIVVAPTFVRPADISLLIAKRLKI